ncbi:MAG: carboxypeptidase-like regulatory domain-containing protein [Saprospiraceae bacterium]|nr:carboxypeptidase-like regulatory domain-containing protein [Saprospiraceae bacterium]MDZ4706752.1 carboxypeptidase-like regulatory domain-containing protein [Saprospiraceae bacterium]
MKVLSYTFKGLFIALVVSLLSLIDAGAQTVSGAITDADSKEPLIGANIAVKDANRGTVSDIQGNFTLEARPGEKLVVSYIGYATQEIALGTG